MRRRHDRAFGRSVQVPDMLRACVPCSWQAAQRPRIGTIAADHEVLEVAEHARLVTHGVLKQSRGLQQRGDFTFAQDPGEDRRVEHLAFGQDGYGRAV